MAFYRNKTQRFTIVAQNIVQDDNLSLKDLGLLVKLLSLPDSWNFSEKGLFKIFPNDGQNSVRTGLKNLEEFGYLKRERKRIKGKLAKVEWSIFDSPQLENPIMEKPSVENPPQYNTKESITDVSTTEEKKKERKTNGYDGILSSIEDSSLREIYVEFLKMRQMKKDPMTDYALTLLIKKVEKAFPDDVEAQKALLNESIEKGWKSVYPKKEGEKNGVHEADRPTGIQAAGIIRL